MTEDPWALPASLFSVIIKREAVARSFPGGELAFEDAFNPARRNGALFLVLHMSEGDVEDTLCKLEEQSIVPGQDVAVADMVHGPLIECKGLSFTSNEHGIGNWRVNISSDQQEARQAENISNTPQVRIQFIDATCAIHDLWDAIGGEASISVSKSAIEAIRSGEEVGFTPNHVELKDDHSDMNWQSAIWSFNDRGTNTCAIRPSQSDGGEDWLEAVRIWIDDEEQPAPKRYWSE